MTIKKWHRLIVGFGMSALCALFGCQRKPADSALGSKGIYKNISARDAHELIDSHRVNSELLILDVRTPSEFQSGHIDGAINLNCNSSDLQAKLSNLDSTKIYCVYCALGTRSNRVMKIMKSMKFETVYNIKGGIHAWNSAGYNTVTP